ncbi:MAG: hypothetical protein ACOC7O_00335 [Thermoplasmatota archaeon]
MIENKLDKKKEIIVHKPYARKILLECYKAPKSLEEISNKHNIPITETYHIASKLKKFGCITLTDEIKRNGQRTSSYKTTSSEILLEERNTGLKMKMS